MNLNEDEWSEEQEIFFDYGVAKGVAWERERIIALLETEATIYADGLLDPAEVIALIKGENE